MKCFYKEINEGFHHVMSCYGHYGCSACPSFFVCLKKKKKSFYIVWLFVCLFVFITAFGNGD